MRSTSPAIVFVVAFAFLFISASDKEAAIEVGDAISKGLVSLDLTGKGGHSGKCVQATIQNKTKKDLLLSVPAGAILKPSDESMQDLLLVSKKSLQLKPGQTRDLELSAFCSNASKRSPSEKIKFTLKTTDNDKLLQLARFLDRSKYSDDVIQSAVWCVSDDKSVSEIYHQFPDSVKELRKEVARITGRKDDWYMVKTNSTVDGSGYIQRAPVLVTGNIHLSNDKPAKLTQEVCKENGEVVWTPKGNTLELPRSGSITFNFKLRVEGWEPGKYFVRVSVPGRVILKQEFQI